MQIYKSYLLLLVIIQQSYQYCHYSNQPIQQNGDCFCIIGFYFNNQNCQQCPNSSTSQDGQYALNPSDCSKCPFGTHYMTQASQPNQSASCVICPNNSFSKTISISDESSCVTCQSGYYKVSNAVDVSSGNQAKAAVCQKCPNNTFRSVNPDPNQQDLFDSVCYQCSEGFYMNQSNKCSLCPNNSTQYQFSSPPFTSKNCNACIVGYYNAESDPSKPVNCQKCPGNTTTLKASPGNISTCICSQNQYITAISTYFSAASCSPCPTGSGRLVKDFNVEGDESQCDVCLEGYYLIAPYQESDGKSVAKGAQCQICPHDSYSIAGTSTSLSSCSLCKINFYMTKPADQNNSAECQPCPGNTGTLAPASSVTDVCNVCAAGYYMNQNFDNGQVPQCSKCPPGSNTNPGINQVCYCYDQNASWSIGQNMCVCNPGSFGLPATSSGSQGCILCPEGYFSTSGSCIPCPPGTYSNSPGSILCLQCTYGTYAFGIGNQLCSSCPNLQTSLSDFTGCKCIDTSAIIMDGNCVCPDGYEGYPSDSASTQGCQACAAGHYSNSSTFQMCTVCLVGTYASGTGNSQCSACPDFQNSLDDFTGCKCIDTSAITKDGNCVCPDGYEGTPSNSATTQGCQACAAGKYSNPSTSGICTVCPVGTYAAGTANSNCKQCDIGWYASNTGSSICQKCGPGSTNSIDFTSCSCIDSNATLAQNNLSCVCNPGYTASPQGCQACAAGKYSNSSTSGICTVCPVGTYAAGTANSNCKQCDIGWYASNTGSSSCQQCGPGFTNSKDFSSCSCIDSNATQTQNNSSCVCNPGYIGSPATSQDSSSKCTACPAGQFVDSGKCSPCAVGTFSSNKANAMCTKCEAGQFANGTGNTKCQTCTPGSTNTDDFSGCKCYDQNSVTWNASSNICQCNSNYYGDASKATETQKSQCIVCPNNSSSKVGAAKTKNDCQVSQSQYNSQYSYSTMIKISILIFFVLFL